MNKGPTARLLALGMILLILLSGCGRERSFNAVVLSNTNGTLVLRPDADSDVYKSGDMLTLSTEDVPVEDQSGHAFSGEDIQEGADLKIYYDGEILESYPLQITGVSKIVLLDS